MAHFSYKINSYARDISRTTAANVKRALTAAGVEAQRAILQQMETGYHAPHGDDGHTAIRQTGELQRDVNFEVR